jgi:hypothetical protein
MSSNISQVATEKVFRTSWEKQWKRQWKKVAKNVINNPNWSIQGIFGCVVICQAKYFGRPLKKKLTRKLYGRQGRQQQTRTLPETTINITPAFPNNLQRKYLQTFFVIY